MKNLLFVSIAFPPKLDPECIQTAKYFKYLAKPKNNFNIDVVTSAIPTLFMPYDPNFTILENGYRQKIEIKIWENKYLNFLLRKVFRSFLQFPDSKFTFHLQWKKVAKNLKNKPNIIYSRSFPLSSTLMAYKLKKYYSVPWVMHLSDPWVDSPLHNYTSKEKKKHSKWELKSFSKADYICFTSAGTVNLYTSKYPNFKHKFKLFPNVYDKENINRKTIIASNKLRFVYTGGLAGNRTPTTLLEAIKSIQKTNNELLDQCEFIFSGDIDKQNKALFYKYNNDSVTHLGHLSYEKSINLQNSAHVLLVIDSPITNSTKSIFFPSKLLDYLAAGKRILAVTTPNSTSDKFIVKHDLGKSFSHSDSTLIKAYIIECIQQFKNKNVEFFQKNKFIEEYEAQFNVDRLVHLFNEVV